MSSIVDQPFLSPIMAGRSQELASIQHWLTQVQTGRGQTLCITGEAGIGKSRLLRELRDLAGVAGIPVIQGNCYAPDRTLPYAPLIDLLAQLPASELRRAQNAVSHLLKLAPELATRVPEIAPAHQAEPEQEKRALVRAWLSILTAPPHADAAWVICIEDIHWCDSETLDVLLLLARAVQSQPILLAVTYRNDEVHPSLAQFITQLDRERLAIEFVLHPLAIDQIGDMVRAIFKQEQPSSTAFLTTLYERSEGNPFFVEEILKALVASGDIFYVYGGWDRKRIEILQVPRSLQVAVSQRVDQLRPETQRLLTLAAVAGRRFDIRLLSHATLLPESTLNSALHELVNAQLVVEEAGDTFCFRHALTQQAIYSNLLLRERKALHQALADAIEVLYAGVIESYVNDLSWHFFKGEVWQPALEYSQRAGAHAQQIYSLQAAIEYYSRAIQAAQNQPRPERVWQLQLARAHAYEQMGEFHAARLDYDAALFAAQSYVDHQAEWQALLGLGFLWASRDYARSGNYFQQALDLAPKLADRASVAQTLNRVGNWHLNAERPHAAIRYHREALQHFEELSDQQGVASTYDLLGISHYVAGEYQQSIGYYQQAAARFRSLQDKVGLLHSLAIGSSRGIALIGRTVAPVAVALVERVSEGEEALQLAIEMGMHPAESLCNTWLGFNYALHGMYPAALRYATNGLQIAEQIEHRHFICTAHMVLGMLHWDLAAWAEARSHLQQALALARETQSLIWQHHTAAFLVSALVQLGELSDARALLQEEWSESIAMDGVGLRQLWAARAEWLLACEEPTQAWEILVRLEETAPQEDLSKRGAIPYLTLLQGEALLARGRHQEAIPRLDAALNVARAAVLPALEWRIELLLGRCLLAKGQRDAAVQAFRGARGCVQLLTADLAAPLRRALLKAATTHTQHVKLDSPRRVGKVRYDGLTTRECSVAAHIARGRSNRDIGEALVLSERTVESHVANILSKLGFTSRIQIATWAIAKGLGTES